MTDAELEKVFVHECMHLLLHETRAGTVCDCPWDIRHEERVATTLQKAFQWIWDAAYEAGKGARDVPDGVVMKTLRGGKGSRVSIPVSS